MYFKFENNKITGNGIDDISKYKWKEDYNLIDFKT